MPNQKALNAAIVTRVTAFGVSRAVPDIVVGNAALFATAIAAALALSFVGSRAQAAVCCGGHAAIPSLITGYERFRVNTSVTNSTLIGQAPAQGLPVFLEPQDQTSRSVVRLSGSYLLNGRWQVGAGIPMTVGSHVGDMDLIAAYEAFPRPTLLSLVPKALIFAQALIPTGQSQATELRDITGSGFFKVALGNLWLTTWRKWDFYALPKATYGFARSISQNGPRRTVSPGWSGDFMVGGGYALTPEWRLGGAVHAAFSEAKRTMRQRQVLTASNEMVWPVSVQVTHFYDMNSTFTLSYEDETVLGPVKNTSLSRSVAFQYSYRWAE